MSNRPAFKSLPAHCRIVEPAKNTQPRPATPTPPPAGTSVLSAPVASREEAVSGPLLCRVSTFDFQDGTNRVVFPKVPKQQTVAFVAHCQRFQPE